MFEITKEVIDPAQYLKHVQDPGNGAIVQFLGVVRNVHEGNAVERIFYECYEKMTLRQMEIIEQEALEKYPMVKLCFVHRVGMVELQEASVLVLTSSKHRKDSYEASMFVMQRIKDLLPIWKKEFHPDGKHSWVNIGS